MSQPAASILQNADVRPWFREPWVWFVIALPAAAVFGCAITIWLAITHPDYLVVDDGEYQQIKAELLAAPAQQETLPGQSDGDN